MLKMKASACLKKKKDRCDGFSMDGNFCNFKAIRMSIYMKENIYLHQRKNVPLYSVFGDTESDRLGVNKCTLIGVFTGVILGLET